MALGALALALDSQEMHARVEAMVDERLTDALEKWKQLTQANPQIEALVNESDLERLCEIQWERALGDEDAELLRAGVRADGPTKKRVTDALQQLVGYCHVQNNIPGQMMSRIESAAAGLAKSLSAGEVDLASLDLTAIGEDVISGCSAEECQALAGNLGSLLPTLAGMKDRINLPPGVADAMSGHGI